MRTNKTLRYLHFRRSRKLYGNNVKRTLLPQYMYATHLDQKWMVQSMEFMHLKVSSTVNSTSFPQLEYWNTTFSSIKITL